MFYIFIMFFLGREQDSTTYYCMYCTSTVHILGQEILRACCLLCSFSLNLFMGRCPFGQIKCTVRLISSPDQLARKRLFNYIKEYKSLLSENIYCVH